ncbi:hypothetical protein EIP91_008862 [Steccherinum ochraceum]|uniref:Uncharacterized protein n=1 Tax=Steccherinum ochraceum TaxID=92696 RepID=A0A4R0RW88_9APHY|nr:hypothetical protein EIP91_008862 [Steccherinum ochraceum]
MAKPSRKRSYSYVESDFEDDDGWNDLKPESDADSDYDPDHDKPRPKKRVKVEKVEAAPKARTKANVTLLATNVQPEQAAASERLGNVDANILARIKKSLALASHSGTGEQEAKAALRMASKLMARHNIDQADVLAEENKDDRMKRAGMSVVTITSLVDGSVRMEGWTSYTANAMEVFFDCKHYTVSHRGGERICFHFYGLAEQTVAAAHGFEMAYNLILDLSQRKKDAKGIRGKNTYRRGIGDGLYSLAKKEKKEEHQRTLKMEKQKLLDAKREEEQEDQRRLERLKDPKIEQPDASPEKGSPKKDVFVKIEEVEDEDLVKSSSAAGNKPLKAETILEPVESTRDSLDPNTEMRSNEGSSSEDDDDDDDSGGGGNEFFDPFDPFEDTPEVQPDFRDSDSDDDMYLNPEELKPHVQLPEPSIAPEPVPQPAQPVKKEEEDASWRSVQQLVQFRATSIAIADDFLKEQGVKLKKGRKDRFQLQHGEWTIYNQGREDAKKIDVKRRRIKGAEED